jgi:predicted dehydrogenase
MSPDPFAVGVVGLGKIARDQHLPSLTANPRLRAVAAASPNSRHAELPTYPDMRTMLAAHPEIGSVALCTPPQVRHALALEALAAGRHVLLEKPPAATVSEAQALLAAAEASGLVLFATWHARHAAGVEPARAWIAARRVRRVQVDWKEDVEKWHPGQAWIWAPGGLGVFDPGINALSIVTRVLPGELSLEGSTLSHRRPQEAPIAADLRMRTPDGATVEAVFDWRPRETDDWSVRVETDEGVLKLADGGAALTIDGASVPLPPTDEYGGVYARFAELLERGDRDVDLRPLILTADAFLRGERVMLPG